MQELPQTAHVIASIAHDLRSPLNSVIGFSRLMLKGIDGALTDMQAADLEAINANGNAMLDMIEDVIDLAKAEAGWFAATPDEIYLQPLVEKAITANSASAKEKGVEVVVQVADSLPPALGDATLVQKVLVKLAAIAIHFASGGSIALAAGADDTTVVVRMVCRPAEGLPADAPTVLGAFRSSGTSSDERVTPVSLKMLTVKWLLALNEGRFWVEERSEDEIAFAFSLPRAAGQQVSSAAPAPA